MGKFEEQFKQLNTLQRKAVENIDGPMLVIAGPGTGKTQLLSMRVANIVKQTDTAPSNILCLTFTDNASRNMRERLEGIIGQPAYHVGIHTFHSFGSEVINQYPDYFSKRQLLQQVDELGRYELLRGIFENLPHSNPLSVKVGNDFVLLKDALTTISWLKQSALAPNELHQILTANQDFIDITSAALSKAFSVTPSPKRLGEYKELAKIMEQNLNGANLFGFSEYGKSCIQELVEAIDSTPNGGRFAPAITTWRNRWCQKDSAGNHVFKDGGRNARKMHALANVYEKFLDKMGELGLYDFDDMIIEVVHALENNDDLRLSLQERYQYILVDEFQDTNKAQLRILACLGNNDVNEGRPNIMAVGDDDQAIYAFQGAETSNIIVFSQMYKDPTIITLTENYRSSREILDASFAVSSQIKDSLQRSLPGVNKHLEAKANYKSTEVAHSVFNSELAQYDWISERIGKYIEQGTSPEQIAVIAPRHKYLERLMPYLGNRRIPVAYERRENILDSPIVLQLITMAKLVDAISQNNQDDVDALISEVLGYDFWNIDESKLLQVSMTCYDGHKHWLPVITEHKDKTISSIARWFLRLSKKSKLEPLEYILDQFIGDESRPPEDDIATSNNHGFVSPMRSTYFSTDNYEHKTDEYLTLLGQLSTLRQRLRQWKPTQTLYVKDLVEFVDLHTQAKLKIVDTNPHTQNTNAVQVMTAYKAKGLEFEIVFVINTQDEIWGPTARTRSSSIALPKNLPLAPASDGDNDKLRLLFVALTRAKHSLHVTSYTHSLESKLSPGLSFIGGNNADGISIHPKLKPNLLGHPTKTESVEILATDWVYRFRQIIADKPALFEPILANYKLSVTHLNNFIDVKDGGPQYFMMHNLLRFPKAPTPSAAYGDAVHKTLQWVHIDLRNNGSMPSRSKIQDYFTEMLDRTHITKTDYKKMNERGRAAIDNYFQKRPKSLLKEDLVERGFNNEGVVIAGANLSGKIDKISFIDTGSVRVVDFKTGKPSESWSGKDDFEKVKLHKYRQQLLFYKLLVEGSASFNKKVEVIGGVLEFVETNEHNDLVKNLELSFEDKELQRFTVLIGAVWKHIMDLDFPDTSKYPKNLKGIQAFEQDLIEGKI